MGMPSTLDDFETVIEIFEDPNVNYASHTFDPWLAMSKIEQCVSEFEFATEGVDQKKHETTRRELEVLCHQTRQTLEKYPTRADISAQLPGTMYALFPGVPHP